MHWADPIFLSNLIQHLDDNKFVALCNSLLGETCAYNGINRSCLATNLHTNEPDGGIDARCVNAPKIVGRLIPYSNVDYQFKGGLNRKSLEKIVEQDIISKPRVIRGLNSGHAFVYIAAWDRGDDVERQLTEKLRTRGISIKDDQVVFIGRDTLARLLQSFPGLIANFFGLDISCFSLEEWASFESLRNPFQTDAVVESCLKDLCVLIEQCGSRVRVVGAAGDGKTRMVLEALCKSSLASNVLYAQQVSDLERSFIAHLGRTKDIQCTLVVDEVDDQNAEKMIDQLSSMPPGVRLVMIGLDASGRAQPNTLQVQGLSETLLVNLIQAIVPGLPPEDSQSIAQDCERSPKLAVLIAKRIKEDPSLVNPSRRLADGKVRSVLDRYFRHDHKEPEWQALSIIAILMRLGWLEDVEHESESLFRAVGLEPSDARRHVEILHERFGIAPLAGRFRYVSPAILADHLAVRQLNTWTRERLKDIVTAMTPAMADSFARRARRLATILSNRGVIEEVILGNQGLFRNLADLESSQIAMLLRHLAAPFPKATLAALRRIINRASLDDLREAKSSRREVVWALEQLLWPEDTFEEAAGLLLRLAMAENESWGNNASATWVEIFQTMLGRTAAGVIPRTRVLQRAATSERSVERKLAAQALGAALKYGHMSRSGMPPSEIEGMPAQEWRPATYGEWADAVISYLNILTPLLKDGEEEVRQTAVSSLAQGITAAIALSPDVMECWILAALSLRDAEYSLRATVCNTIETTFIRWENKLNKDSADIEVDADDEILDESARAQRADAIRKLLVRLNAVSGELQGKDFSSRLRSVLSRSTWRFRKQQERDLAEQDITHHLEALAIEAIAQPDLLDGEWDWLHNYKQGVRAEQWVQVLGRIDNHRIFQSVLSQLATQSSRARMWLSLYDLSYAQATQDAGFIDRRVAELISTGSSPESVFDLLYRAGYHPSRLQVMVLLFKTQEIPAWIINNLAYYPWGANLPPFEALQLAEAAIINTENPTAIIPFVSNYLEQKKDAIPTFQDLALQLILAAKKHSTKDFESEWADLARLYIDKSPVQIAQIALQRIAKQKYSVDGDAQDVLLAAWQTGDKEQLFKKVFAPMFTLREVELWSLRQSLTWFPFKDLDANFLIDWVAEDPKERAYSLADVIGAPTGAFSELHASLLDRFNNYGVGGSFFASFNSGSWVGSHAGWTRSKLDRARSWVDDERPAVREWARNLVRNLEEDLKRDESREAEERFYR